MKPIVWSFGGGTQSAAIAVLIADGKLPVPERCIIADTGRESSETWEYTDALAPVATFIPTLMIRFSVVNLRGHHSTYIANSPYFP